MFDLQKIRRRVQTPTSKKDLMYMLHGAVKVLTYEDTLQYNTLDDLLGQYENVIILYPNSDNGGSFDDPVGHWIALFSIPGSKPKSIQYFDSYGCYVDDMIQEYDQEAEERGGEIIPTHVAKLIVESEDEVDWNETKFQGLAGEANTCGLWCVIRIKNNHLNENQFKKIFHDLPISQGISPDLLVADMILNMYPEMDKSFEETKAGAGKEKKDEMQEEDYSEEEFSEIENTEDEKCEIKKTDILKETIVHDGPGIVGNVKVEELD